MLLDSISVIVYNIPSHHDKFNIVNEFKKNLINMINNVPDIVYVGQIWMFSAHEDIM